MPSISSTVTKGGRTVIPLAIREAFGIKAGDILAWIDDGQGVRVVVVSRDMPDGSFGREQDEIQLSKALEDRQINREHDL